MLLHNNDCNDSKIYDSYTLKSLCSMVAKEALKSLLCWSPAVSVLYVIIESNEY